MNKSNTFNSIFFIFFIFCTTLEIVAQNTISGSVVDEKNQPLQGVSLYFDGTTIGTFTDENGRFYLALKALPKTNFVVHYLGYESQYFESFESSNSVIKLKPSTLQLNEVVLVAPPFSRKEMLNAFREHFLGTTKAGKKCVIVNEDDIQFQYDATTKILTANSVNNLQILNEVLGYKISFNLIDFQLKFSKKSLSNSFLLKSFFAGTSFYEDVSNEAIKTKNKRIESYKGSSKHFFKNLVDEKWSKKDFLLFDGSFGTDPKSQFQITKTDFNNNVLIINNKLQKIEGEQRFFNVFNTLYNNKDQSKIIFKTQNLIIDAYGNHAPIDMIEFSGEMSKKRVGDMLPLDFVLE